MAQDDTEGAQGAVRGAPAPYAGDMLVGADGVAVPLPPRLARVARAALQHTPSTDLIQGLMAAHIRTDTNAKILCELMASGIPWTRAAAQIGLPSTAVYLWLDADGPFAAAFEAAREAGADQVADGVREMVRKTELYSDKRARLIMDADFKWLEKRHARRYGAKIEVESRNANVNVDVSTDAQEAARAYQEIMRSGGK